ncbi:dihydrofolate reductase family protein [Actinomadura sp. 3N407]|uniref:dihydrofolate reductase family protein n=1 Tax=Actinomadura sp. 3N407 TaxID=3457423 RepID=UPI003FCEB1C0
MRKLIVINIISLDGYFEGPGNDVMALPIDEGFSEYNVERLRAAGTLLLGRASYEGFRSYWPPIADDASEPPVEREISRLNNAIDKVVVSDTLTPEETAPWHDTEIVKRADAHARVAALKESPGKDIVMFGSHTLWNDLLAAGLVDELHTMIGAGVLGAGTPMFEGAAPVRLRLLEARALPGSELVLIRHAPAAA